MARDHARLHSDFEIVGGYLSPVSDQYKKPGLAPGAHRFNMCSLACKRESDWLSVDGWEVQQPAYSKTADVLDHFKEELNVKHGGVEVLDEPGERRPVRIMLLAGSDLIQTMSEPDVWDVRDVSNASTDPLDTIDTCGPSFTTSWATTAVLLSSARSPKLTSPYFHLRQCIPGAHWHFMPTTFTWYLNSSATMSRQPKFGCSSKRT